jgi:hypothetical protein
MLRRIDRHLVSWPIIDDPEEVVIFTLPFLVRRLGGLAEVQQLPQARLRLVVLIAGDALVFPHHDHRLAVVSRVGEHVVRGLSREPIEIIVLLFVFVARRVLHLQIPSLRRRLDGFDGVRRDCQNGSGFLIAWQQRLRGVAPEELLRERLRAESAGRAKILAIFLFAMTQDDDGCRLGEGCRRRCERSKSNCSRQY